MLNFVVYLEDLGGLQRVVQRLVSEFLQVYKNSLGSMTSKEQQQSSLIASIKHIFINKRTYI